MNYIEQSDVEDYLDITLSTNGVNLFNLLLPNMQDMIDQYCNRSWNFTNPITETFNGLKDNTTQTLEDTFFPKYTISETVNNNSFPQAKGIISVETGLVNGVGSPIDLTYVYSYKTHVKVWAWNYMTNMFNPLGLKAVQIQYNSDDAESPPNPIKQALIEWIGRKIQTAQDSNRDAIMVQAGQVRVNYKADEVGGIPDFVRVVLDRYRMPSLDHF